MERFSLYIFIGACLALLLWGLRRPERVYEYPFLMGAIFSAFLIPQAIALVDNPGVIEPWAVSQTLLMGALCLGMAWVGYQLPPMRAFRRRWPRPLSLQRLKLAAYATMGISLLAMFAITRLPQSEITSTGSFTILVFFAGLSAISFPILFALAIRQPTVLNWIVAAIAGYPIVASVFIGGRRSDTATLLVMIAVVLFFQKRILPTRLIAIGGVLAAAFMIPAMAAIREDIWPALVSGSFSAIPWKESMDKVLSGEILELRNAAAAVYASTVTGIHGWGTGYWDAIVFRYVPGQLVGFDVKSGLQFNWTSGLYHSIGYDRHTGTTPTAIGDTFIQFGYFGSLFFLLQGYLFRNLWYLATARGSFITQAAYVGLITPALLGVTHGSVWFFQGGLIIVLVLYTSYRFSRRRGLLRPGPGDSRQARSASLGRSGCSLGRPISSGHYRS